MSTHTSPDPAWPHQPGWATLERHERDLVCRFHEPVHVLSTSREQGGLRNDLSGAINYQVCEPGGCPTCEICIDDLDDHIDDHASGHGCVADRCVTMMTSASPGNAGWAHREHQGVEVWAALTGGVETNAARAGDPASHYEGPEGFTPVDEPLPVGTINLILLISHPLSPGGLVKASITATEAKTATLQALRVRSMYGCGLATGTGTDQLVIACPQQGAWNLSEAQAHTRLGQMIAEVVDQALRQTLELQGGLTTLTRRSVRAMLMRFGATVDVGEHDAEPQAIAAAIALAVILDHQRWGLLPDGQHAALLARYGAQLGHSLGAGDGLETSLLSALGAHPSPADFITLILDSSER